MIRNSDRDRFIPTLVGNAFAFMNKAPFGAVHPHARGERVSIYAFSCKTSGSSPRSWGTRTYTMDLSASARFIPTLVGNASTDTGDCLNTPVHPHARGERPVSRVQETSPTGSSPRSWGTLFCGAGGTSTGRFIPTLVGNADAAFFAALTVSVHPHARGERGRRRVDPDRVGGSSPRSWGTPLHHRESLFPFRFIPTLVGNAMIGELILRPTPVHPHARGERPVADPLHPSQVGSSPRSWGTRDPVIRGPHLLRFIPTLVGNARPITAAMLKWPVHPHARGER